MTMEKIASFTVNHLNLLRGIYLSRKDVTPSGDTITTFDIRMTEPNRMPAISGEVLHTIERPGRNIPPQPPLWAHKVIYWGPMGCCTGNYLLLSGDYKPEDIIPLIKETFSFVAGFEGDIPEVHPATAETIRIWTPKAHAGRHPASFPKYWRTSGRKCLFIRSRHNPIYVPT